MMYITTLQIQKDEYGRFGNQLFRIAAVYAAAKRQGINYKFPEWKYSCYFSNEKEFGNINLTPIEKYYESGFHYNQIPKFTNDLEIFGYFQSEKYFSDYKNEVKDFFTFKDSFLDKIKEEKFIIQPNNCSIHFRHGDIYDRENGSGHVGCEEWHPVMTAQYYKNSINKMIEMGINNFYIFFDHSETKNWVLKNIELSHINYTFSNLENSNITDFALMSSCDHNIIANSSFSWWAAWLNENPEKMVICPKQEDWLGVKLSGLDPKDLIPEGWIQMDKGKLKNV